MGETAWHARSHIFMLECIIPPHMYTRRMDMNQKSNANICGQQQTFWKSRPFNASAASHVRCISVTTWRARLIKTSSQHFRAAIEKKEPNAMNRNGWCKNKKRTNRMIRYSRIIIIEMAYELRVIDSVQWKLGTTYSVVNVICDDNNWPHILRWFSMALIYQACHINIFHCFILPSLTLATISKVSELSICSWKLTKTNRFKY